MEKGIVYSRDSIILILSVQSKIQNADDADVIASTNVIIRNQTQWQVKSRA